MLIAPPESAIQDTRFKRESIGISYNSIIEFVTDGLLKEDGIDPSEANKASIPKTPVRMEMLFNNQADAITVPDPLVTFAEFKGRMSPRIRKKSLPGSIAFQQKTLEENMVEASIEPIQLAVEDLNNNPEDYKDLDRKRQYSPTYCRGLSNSALSQAQVPV